MEFINPDADGHAEPAGKLIHFHVPADRLHQFDAFHEGAVGEDQREIVTEVAIDEIGWSDRLLDDADKIRYCLVTNLTAVSIVDSLEMVNVQPAQAEGDFIEVEAIDLIKITTENTLM